MVLCSRDDGVGVGGELAEETAVEGADVCLGLLRHFLGHEGADGGSCH